MSAHVFVSDWLHFVKPGRNVKTALQPLRLNAACVMQTLTDHAAHEALVSQAEYVCSIRISEGTEQCSIGSKKWKVESKKKKDC